MDNFYEQLLKTYKTVKYKTVRFLLFFFGVSGLFLLMMLAFIPAVILIALSIGMFFLKKRLFIEYEYDFTSGEIAVDKIVEMKKRSRLYTFNIKEVELLAPESSYYVKDFSNKPQKTAVCYPKTANGQVYAAMVTGGSERLQLKFMPDEKFLELCHKYNPRAVKTC